MNKRLALLLALGVFVVILAYLSRTLSHRNKELKTNTVNTVTPTPTITTEQFAKEIIILTNKERVKNGLGELKENELLNRSAKLKSEDMISRNYWSHNTPDGSETWVFFNKVSFMYQDAGENLSQAFTTPTEVFNAWMVSPSHKENILDSRYTNIGVSVDFQVPNNLSISKPLVVQHFGSLKSKQIQVKKESGARSGQIIKYHEWCTNKDINIYENELITKKSLDGNTYTMTSGDWECYHKTYSKK